MNDGPQPLSASLGISMIENMRLDRKCLVEIRIGQSHEKVHPAWQDDTSRGFLVCYDINLIFDDQSMFLVQPCEVEITGRYPALGLSLERIEDVDLSSPLKTSFLPMRVKEVVQTDYMGEDVINQYVLALENGSKITIRHVLPPMTLGVKMEEVNA